MTRMDPAKRLARRLAALPEPVMRESVFLEYLARTDPAAAVEVLSEIHARGRKGGPPFNIALLTVGSVLSRRSLEYDLQSNLYLAAKEQGHDAVARLFFSNQDVDPGAVRREEELEETLGHRKWRARSQDRDVLARLLRTPEPEVVRNLLENPRIIERDVIQLAARRPAHPEVQREIFSSRRWIARYAVKRALVLNPYTPTNLALRLIGLLSSQDLKLVITSPSLPAPLRAAAEEQGA